MAITKNFLTESKLMIFILAENAQAAKMVEERVRKHSRSK
jgi:hypothetical protein